MGLEEARVVRPPDSVAAQLDASPVTLGLARKCHLILFDSHLIKRIPRFSVLFDSYNYRNVTKSVLASTNRT